MDFYSTERLARCINQARCKNLFESFGGILMWNGFESAVPVYQINVDLPNNTALAVDGLRANVAESSSVLMIVAGLCGLLSWRYLVPKRTFGGCD